jgi:hypothetical protein
VTEQLDGNIRVGNVVKNPLPEKIPLKSSWVPVKRRFAFRRAIEMMPGLGRHLLARDGTQLPKPHLF